MVEGMILQGTSTVSTKPVVFGGGRQAQVVAPLSSTSFSTTTTTAAATTTVSHPVGGGECIGWITRGEPEQHSSILTPWSMATNWSFPSETVPTSKGHTFSILNLMTFFVKNSMTTSTIEDEGPNLGGTGIWFISTLKRRRKMMNKHKLRKRRKKNRMKSKK
eukprot:CAMPEP_0113458928 /NCGR_PEP_ID=MMETSP0014_2-20120614/10177_1 /TAXON_ID=2857 /ORGANISM="Nitzschia sp." /LENGTH=161 /DNA_ID=CAMNT_0000350471 /DNA_START=221 /DNA_END=706 /DNA_ORIENTATION=+ /assembly_acc=CAM_ASM_000159